MNKKILLTIAALIVIIVGASALVIHKNNNPQTINKKNNNEISNNQSQSFKTYDYTENLNLENIQVGNTMASFEEPFTPDNLLKQADAVAIVSVVSKDKADTNLNSWVGSTYGKMVINNSLYGSLKEGGVVGYTRAGGIMTYEEYNKNQPDEAKAKHESLWQENGIDPKNTYVDLRMGFDIDIEAGKTYLAYLVYMEEENLYCIIGFEYGLREVNVAKKDSATTDKLDVGNYKILNNETGNYESLNDYIKTNINDAKVK